MLVREQRGTVDDRVTAVVTLRDQHRGALGRVAEASP
jgi:hypothetical protein